MKIRTITVEYGQTLTGPKQYESERIGMQTTAETETEEEGKVSNLKKNAKKLFSQIRDAVEQKSGRTMRRHNDD